MPKKTYNTDPARQNGSEKLRQARATLSDILDSWEEDPALLAEELAFRGKFHQYSMRNVALIHHQNPNTAYVASASAWKKKGYAVKYNEYNNGMSILCPELADAFLDASGVTKKIAEASAEERKQITNGSLRRTKQLIGYHVGTVYDISQTTCPPEDYPKLYNVGYDSSQHAALYEAVKRFAGQNGYTVRETDAPGGTPSITRRGIHSSAQSEIAINDRLRDTQKLDTLVHEVGHSLLHRDEAGKAKPTAIKELEADGVSIMLASALGIAVTDQRKRHFAASFEQARQVDGFELNKLLPGIVSAYDKVWAGIEQEIAQQPGLPKPRGRETASRTVPSHIGAGFDAEAMTQERYDALIAAGERAPYFENLHFRGIKFPAEVGGRFDHCTFMNCDFSGSTVNAQFQDCSIYSAQTEGAFFHAGFQHCTIAQTTFQNARLSSAFHNVAFRRCNARNTAFESCIFDGGIMDRFSLQEGVTAVGTQGLDTVGITMSGATRQEKENHTRQIFEVLNAVHEEPSTEATPIEPVALSAPPVPTAPEPAKPQHRETVVVNLFAGPGAGKTTCAWEIAEKLKKLGYVTEYVPEYAKELVWDGRMDLLDGSLAHQKLLRDEQARRVDRLLGKVDFVVTDSPLLMNVSYLKEPDAAYEQEVLEQFNARHNFNIFIERGSRFEKEGRIHDEEQSHQLDQSIQDMLRRNGVYFGAYRYETVDLSIANMQTTHAKLGNGRPRSLDAAIATPSGAPRLFLDMDGTLARFHDNVNCLEQMYKPDFFANLAPYADTVEAVHQFVLHHPDAEVFVVSALIDSPTCAAEKNVWLDKYLPEIDAAHRIFVPAGENKANHISGGVHATDILIDDYNHNLEEWQEAGGHSVKFVNHINDQGSNGEMWDGDRIAYDMTVVEQEAALRYQEQTVKEQHDAQKAAEAARRQFAAMCHVIHQYEASVGTPRDDTLVTLQFDGQTAYWAPRSGVSDEQLQAAARQYGRWLEYGKEVDSILSDTWTAFDRSHIVMGWASEALAKYGFDESLPLMVSANKLRDLAAPETADGQEHPHGLSADTIKRLPAAIADPAMVMISATHPNDSLVVVSRMTDAQGRPIIISLRSGRGYIEAERMQANVMTSAYGRNGFNDFLRSALEQNRLLYVDEQQSRQLSQLPGVQFPEGMAVGDYPDNIARFRETVNAPATPNPTEPYSSTPAAEQPAAPVQAQPVTAAPATGLVSAEPTVTILFSESDQLQDGQILPLHEANDRFARLDAAYPANRGYDKTKFRIDCIMNGQTDSYEGRYDIGDGDGSLTEHIRSHWAYYAQQDDWRAGLEPEKADEIKAASNRILNEFVPYLEMHCNLSQMEQAAQGRLQSGETLTPEETAYCNAVLSYVQECRPLLNRGGYPLPDAPQMTDFTREALERDAYAHQVRSEVAQEAAAAGMTVEEYAANGYVPREQPTPEPVIQEQQPEQQPNNTLSLSQEPAEQSLEPEPIPASPAPEPSPAQPEQPAPAQHSRQQRTANRYDRQEDTIDRIKQEIPITRVIEACGYTLQRRGRLYNLKEHDSLMVYPDSNSFYRFSTGKGGSAIDFLMQMQDMTQAEAIQTLASQLTEHPTPLPMRQESKTEETEPPKELELPPAGKGKFARAMAYLTKTRCIDPEVVTSLMRSKGHGSYIYQDDRNNVVFVGVDPEGNPAYAARRSTLTTSSFKGDVSGSDGDIGWFVDNHAEKLYVTESTIDAMSLMTMRKEAGQAVDSASYLSLGGTGKTAALATWLRARPEIREVVAACDRDEKGVQGNERITDLVKEQFPDVGVKIFDNFGDRDSKDLNEALCAKKRREQQLQKSREASPSFSPSHEKEVAVEP